MTIPIATFNTLVGFDGMLREGQDQHFVGYILKMGLILVIHVSFHNTSFAGLTTIVIVYALILIMTEIKCKNCNCNETLNIFTPSKVYLYGCVKFSYKRLIASKRFVCNTCRYIHLRVNGGEGVKMLTKIIK